METLILSVVLGLLFIGAMIFVRIKQVQNDKEFDVRWVQSPIYDEAEQRLSFAGGHTGKPHIFYGTCTVWYDMYGKRCGTLMECQLSEIWHYCKNKN